MTTQMLTRISTGRREASSYPEQVPLELDVEVFRLVDEIPPIRVNNSELVVESSKLEIKHIYPFTYLDTRMFLWKEEDNSVNIYQIIEE